MFKLPSSRFADISSIFAKKKGHVDDGSHRFDGGVSQSAPKMVFAYADGESCPHSSPLTLSSHSLHFYRCFPAPLRFRSVCFRVVLFPHFTPKQSWSFATFFISVFFLLCNTCTVGFQANDSIQQTRGMWTRFIYSRYARLWRVGLRLAYAQGNLATVG